MDKKFLFLYATIHPISTAEFLRELNLPPHFKYLKEFYNADAPAMTCSDGRYTNSTKTYLKSVYVPHDRITHVPKTDKQVVLGFKEYLYRYMEHPAFLVLNADNYEWELNLNFVKCSFKRRRTLRLVLPPNPDFRTDTGKWRTTAREVHFILNSGIPMQIFKLDKRNSLQFLLVPA